MERQCQLKRWIDRQSKIILLRCNAMDRKRNIGREAENEKYISRESWSWDRAQLVTRGWPLMEGETG